MKKDPALPKHPNAHLRFAVLATDVALFTIIDGELCVRVMTVHRPPHFNTRPGLPGALIRPDETAEETARRIIKEKGGIASNKPYLEQLATFSRVDRDPRGRVVAVAYLGLVPASLLSAEESDGDTGGAYWIPIKKATRLAYDHDEILLTGLSRLRSRIHYTTLIGKLMPREFTLTELERAYECILTNTLDKRNFRKKILKLGIVTATGKKRTDGAFRPAELYRMASPKVEEIEVL